MRLLLLFTSALAIALAAGAETLPSVAQRIGVTGNQTSGLIFAVSLILVVLACFHLYVFVMNKLEATRPRSGKIGVPVGIIGGLAAFDFFIRYDGSEILELCAALVGFALPICFIVVILCDWFPWRIVPRDPVPMHRY